MTIYPGYEILQKVHESGNTLIQRGLRLSDGKPVMLKSLRDAYFTPERLARFKREFEITASLNPGTDSPIDGVICALSMEDQQNEHYIVTEDFGGSSLDLYEGKGSWNLADFFKLAFQVIDALGEVHQRQIIHKDINP